MRITELIHELYQWKSMMGDVQVFGNVRTERISGRSIYKQKKVKMIDNRFRTNKKE